MINFFLKGTRFNPYNPDEFPRYHIKNVSREELARLEQVWNRYQDTWRDRVVPDWDLIFRLANVGLEFDTVPVTSKANNSEPSGAEAVVYVLTETPTETPAEVELATLTIVEKQLIPVVELMQDGKHLDALAKLQQFLDDVSERKSDLLGG